eukprot:scaffold4705_cov108-Cylindrotheca_fusiformis.AAC.2
MDDDSDEFDQICLTIKAMIKQEKIGYRIHDYLADVPEPNDKHQRHVDSDIRFLIAQWTLQLADVCEYKSETSWIAMSCLDRFLASPNGFEALLDCRMFQNAALTALYMSIKMNEVEVLGPVNMAQLSRGHQTEGDIEEMEVHMLHSLGWRVNPPTALSFVCMFLKLAPTLDPGYDSLLMEIAEFQIQQSILDYDLCRVRASKVAFATTLNSVAIAYKDKRLCTGLQKMIASVTGIRSSSIRNLQERLFHSIPQEKLEAWCQEPQTTVYEEDNNTYTNAAKSDGHGNSPRSLKEQL